MMKLLLGTACLLLMLTACGQADDASREKTADTAPDGMSKGAVDRSACDTLEPRMVKAALGVDVEDVEARSSAFRTYTSCTISWNSDKQVTREIAGRTATYQAENRVTLTRSIFEGSAADAFNAMIRQISEHSEPESITGVGDEAMWMPSMNQISVLTGRRVFHVTVEYHDGDSGNLSYARHLALAVIAALR